MRDGEIEGLGNGQTENIWVSNKIKRSIIKAFNTLLTYSLSELGCEKGSEGRLAMQFAGDNESQKKIAIELIDECGFDSYDAESLEKS